MILIYTADNSEVKENDIVLSSRNERYKVTGWREPQHAGSTGRVYVAGAGASNRLETSREFFPSVFNMKFV